MKRNKRITLTLPPDELEVLERISTAMGKAPGKVAKEIVMETLGSIIEMFGIKDGTTTYTSNQALKRMYQIAFNKMLSSLDELP